MRLPSTVSWYSPWSCPWSEISFSSDFYLGKARKPNLDCCEMICLTPVKHLFACLLGIQGPSVASYYEMSNSSGVSVPAWTVSSPLFGSQLSSIQINELGLKIFKIVCCIPDVFCMLIFIRNNIFQWSAYELKFCFNICIFRMWWFTCLRAAKNMCKVRNLIWLCGTLC